MVLGRLRKRQLTDGVLPQHVQQPQLDAGVRWHSKLAMIESFLFFRKYLKIELKAEDERLATEQRTTRSVN